MKIQNSTIQAYLENPNHDYISGCNLLAKYGNKNLARTLSMKSPKFNFKELEYELRKLMYGSSAVSVVAPKVVVPDIITKAKAKVHQTWVKLSKLQNELYDLGTSNEEELMANRKKMLDTKSDFAFFYDALLEELKSYEETHIVSAKLKELMEVPEENNKSSKNAEIESNPYLEMNAVALGKKIHAAEKFIKLYENRLNFQTDTVGEKPNPMPDCPKRTQYKKKIADKQKELELMKVAFNKK